MRRKALLLAAVAVASILTTSAQATMRITGDPGGLIIAYAERSSHCDIPDLCPAPHASQAPAPMRLMSDFLLGHIIG